MTINEIQDALKHPFPREDIEFRVSRVSAKKNKACVVPYIKARGIMQRLDEVFDIAHWKDEYEVLQSGVKCKLSVFLGSEWITKEDVAPFTNIEALKGAFSDSLKRAGVKFGIGRYIYDVQEHWVDIFPERPKDTMFPVHYQSSEGMTGWWIEPQLPAWALPGVKLNVPMQYMELLEELKHSKILTNTKYEKYAQALADSKLSEIQKSLIWEQLSLIKAWGERIVNNAGVAVEVKKELYRKIIGSNTDSIGNIRYELFEYADKGAAA